MTSPVEAVAEAAMKLPSEDREVLVEQLLASLASDCCLHPDWPAEIARRVRDLQAGRTPFMPAESALAQLAVHIHGRRPAA